MTQIKYQVLQHIHRVKYHYCFNAEESDLGKISEWAWEANAILFFPDSTVRDPSGRVLIRPNGGDPDAEAKLPYPADAIARRARSNVILCEHEVPILKTLPPVLGESEVDKCCAADIAQRALALFVVALRAESLNIADEVPANDLQEISPLGFKSLSPDEVAFIKTPHPEQQQIFNFLWRYEALNLLMWALQYVDDLSYPSDICDVPGIAEIMLELNQTAFVKKAKLRPIAELLDALDLHYRLHCAVRQAHVAKKDVPGGLEEGVVQERHYALNWLLRFENENAEWDDIQTPT